MLPESLGHRKHILAEIEQENKLPAPRQLYPSATALQQSYMRALAPNQARTQSAHSRHENDKSIDIDQTQTDIQDPNETNSHNLVLKTVSFQQQKVDKLKLYCLKIKIRTAICQSINIVHSYSKLYC